ncbi:hypothetical protein Tco_0691891 [Tanacetum coccineum]
MKVVVVEATLLSETPSFDDTVDEDIAEFEVASKSKSSTTKPKKVTAHKVAIQKVQTKAFPAKIPVPIRNCIHRLVLVTKPLEQENQKMQ